MDNIIYFIKSFLTSEMTTSGFPVIYKGEMSHQITRSFAFMASRKITEKNLPTSTRKRIFHIMIECLQNVTKHSDDFDQKDHKVGNGLFIVSHKKDSFYVVTGNIVKNESVKPLEDRLIKINGSSAQELKDSFLKQMVEGELNESGGAGLGLIDIARKSGRKFFYHFVPFDRSRQYFVLVVTIPIDKDSREEKK